MFGIALSPNCAYSVSHEVEAESRIRRLHEHDGSFAGGSARRTPTTRERISRACSPKPAQTRSKEKAQAFSFPRPCRRLEWRRRTILACQVIIGQPLAGDLRDYCAESIRIVHVLPVVVAKSLFVD